VAVRVRVLTVGLLVLGGSFCSPSLAEGSSVAPAWPAAASAVVRQQPPVSTIPPLPQPPLFSTIPPLPPTATPIRPTATATPVPRPAPPPVAPTPIPPRPTAALPAPSQSTPRAGGFPTEVVLLVFAGSATALGSGLYFLTRSRPR
jgi:hypothetical protein